VYITGGEKAQGAVVKALWARVPQAGQSGGGICTRYVVRVDRDIERANKKVIAGGQTSRKDEGGSWGGGLFDTT